MIVFNNHNVNGFTSHSFGLDDISWINPYSVDLDWVMMGNLKPSNLTQFSLFVLSSKLNDAIDFGSTSKSCNHVTFLDFRDNFGCTVSQFDHRVSREASSSRFSLAIDCCAELLGAHWCSCLLLFLRQS